MTLGDGAALPAVCGDPAQPANGAPHGSTASSSADNVYSLLGFLDGTQQPGRVPGARSAASSAGGDFVKDDLIAAAVDLLLAAQTASCLASPEALAEPAARVRRVQAALAELSEHLA